MPKFMRSLNVISRCQSAFRTKKMKGEPAGCYHSLILALCRGPGRSQDELAKDICINKSGVARALASLEAEDFVLRRPDPMNKRKTIVEPTEKLISVLPKIRETTAEWNSLVSQGISEEELAVFESVILRMENNARQIIKGLEEGPDR